MYSLPAKLVSKNKAWVLGISEADKVCPFALGVVLRRLVNKAKYTVPGLYQEKEHVLRFLIYGGS